MSSLLARTTQYRPGNENRIRGLTEEDKRLLHLQAMDIAKNTVGKEWDTGLVQLIENHLIEYRRMGL